MGKKTALAASTIALLSGAASAQISFTNTGSVLFTETFNPDGGVFSAGSFTAGETGFFTAETNGQFSLTYLGQESSYADGVRINNNGQTLTESAAIGTSIVGPMTSGSLLDFTFFASGGDDVPNGETISGHSSFALLDRNVTTPAGTFAYVVGYNDSFRHDDWDDYVIGINSIVPIPEPSVYALILAGLGAMGFAARRKLRS